MSYEIHSCASFYGRSIAFQLTWLLLHTQGRTVMHTAAEKGSCKACEVILNLRLDAVYDTDKKVPLLVTRVHLRGNNLHACKQWPFLNYLVCYKWWKLSSCVCNKSNDEAGKCLYTFWSHKSQCIRNNIRLTKLTTVYIHIVQAVLRFFACSY